MRSALRGLWALAHATCVVLSLASCSHVRPKSALGPPPVLPDPRHAARLVVLPEWYWEPVDVAVSGDPKNVELPIAESSIARVEGATRLWDELGAAGRERLSKDGLVVLAADPAQKSVLQMGAFYMDMRNQRVPYAITLDALAYIVHVASERALAEVDESVIAPQLDVLLAAFERRLAAEQKGAGVEIGEGYRVARSIIAVARRLADPSAVVPADLEPFIMRELARINAHEGPATSDLLAAVIDYASFAPALGAAHPGSFLALTWLATAPLILVAETEVPGPIDSIDVASARLNMRAAMLLARLTEREIDPEIAAAWSRIARLATFVWGPPDDLSPSELAEIAAAGATTLVDPKNVANVVKVDKLRKRAAQGRAPALFGSSGAAGRAGISMRLFGGHAPPDSVALATFVSPDGTRPPSPLDLAVWIGASDARAALRDDGADAWAGYDAALARAVTMRPADEAASRHSSVHGSMLDVVMTWLTPTPANAERLASPAAQRAAIESALAAWTYARHQGQPLSRPKPFHSAHAPKELQVSGAALPAFVEPAPEVIGRLVATVGQMKRGLAALGGLGPTSPTMTTLAEVDDILRTSLRIATRETNDEPFAAEDLTALASLPARIARLEENDDAARVMVPVVAEVFADRSGQHVVSSATGAIEPALMILREPGSGRFVLAAGAHVAHHELVETRHEQSNDATHRARFLTPAVVSAVGAVENGDAGGGGGGGGVGDGGVASESQHKNAGVPARLAYTSSFRLVR